MKNAGTWVWPIAGVFFVLSTGIIGLAALLPGPFEAVPFWPMVGLGAGVILLVAVPVLYFLAGKQMQQLQKLENALVKLSDGDTAVEIPSNPMFASAVESLELLRKNMKLQQDYLKSISAGDLSLQSQSEGDGFGGALENMRLSLSHVVDRIVDSAKLVKSVADDLHKTSNSMNESSEALSREATMVASSSEESSSTVNNIAAMTEELSSTVAAISDNARLAMDDMQYLSKALENAQRECQQYLSGSGGDEQFYP